MNEPERHLHIAYSRDAADAPPLPLPDEEELEPMDGGEGRDIAIRDEPEPPAVATTGEVVEPTRIWQPRTIDIVEAVARRVEQLREPHTRRRATRGLLGAAVTTAQGVHSWTSRAYDAATLGVYRRQIRAAEASGDREALADWMDRKERAVAQRRGRLMDLPLLMVNVAKGAGIGCAGLLVSLLGLSTAVWATGVGEFSTVWVIAGEAIGWALTAVSWAWPALPVVVLVKAYQEGKRTGTPPSWIAAPADDGTQPRDVVPDEGAIINALRNLGIADLNRAFKRGWRPRIFLPTHQEGKGYRTQIELPPAVPVEMILKKKTVLAHNLVRFPIEVWPTEPKAGVLDLWVANPGALSGPVDPWPLLHEGDVDYFKSTPVGVNIRGKVINGRLSEANYAIAGMMGSGKSTLIITLLLGALLDPLVDADVFVMAVNADYDPMKPRLRTLLTGSGDEVVEACLNTLREAYADLDPRGKALQEHGVRAVNRAVAEKDARLRPRIIVVDECQALFLHEEYGEEAISLAVRLLNAARKYGYTLIFATPEPSSASLPRKLMAVISNKACFAIGDQTSNDAVLGSGAYKAGISAVGLEPKTDESLGDVGTCMGKSFEPKPALLRCFYVSQSEAEQVVERALRNREKARIGDTEDCDEDRDLLADLLEVIGPDPVPAAQALAALRSAFPRHRPYALLGDRLELVRELALLGVKVPSSKNRYPVDPATIRDRMAELAAEASVDEDDAG